MRFIKMLGLAAVAAVAAMALVGASSAMAEKDTALCLLETVGGNCPLIDHIHFESVKPPELKSTFLGLPITILCLESLALGDVEGPLLATAPTPLKIQITEGGPTWGKCGTNKAHDNCKEIKTLKSPLFDVLNNGGGLGTAIALGAEVLVECTIAGVTLHCVYGGAEVGPFTVEGALHNGGEAGHGMFTAKELTVPMISGKNCPTTSKWTALYEPLDHIDLTT